MMAYDEQHDASERMADTLDVASRLAQVDSANGIRAAQKGCEPQGLPVGKEGAMVYQIKDKVTGLFPFPACEDCGDELPVARCDMGRIRCTPCQSALEKKPRRR